MKPGYAAPLYLLPFDHRHSYVSGMFHLTPPLTADQHAAVTDSKRVIYDAFREALGGSDVPRPYGGIMIDEEFGAAILRDAVERGYVTALATEKSGSDELELQYGTAFATHIESFRPTFAKVLVRYNPESDPALNERQTTRLRALSDYCRAVGQLFMFELLVPATFAQEQRCAADGTEYDLALRPGLTNQAVAALQDAGVEPDVWKVEGFDSRDDAERFVATAHRGGRDEVGCIVLGRGADEGNVAGWLETAASVRGFTGFAVGRTTYWDAVADYVAGRATRQEASSRIAHRYRKWASIFQRSRPSPDRTIGMANERRDEDTSPA
jgi:myo-inositol catabolism protein IolC